MVRVDNKNVFIISSCIGEGLHVTYAEDIDETFLSFWEYGCKDSKTAWKYRLRHIWHIIKYGTPFDDEVMLDKIGRTMLIETLINHGVAGLRVETFTSSTEG